MEQIHEDLTEGDFDMNNTDLEPGNTQDMLESEFNTLDAIENRIHIMIHNNKAGYQTPTHFISAQQHQLDTESNVSLEL